MLKCENCQVEIKGYWDQCPLCHQDLEGRDKAVSSSYPDIPLKFSYQRISKWLISLSIVIIVLTLIAEMIIWQGNIQWLQGALFGIVTMWLVVLTIVRKRRNLAKSLLYLLVILSLLSVYLDYLIGWSAWSTTFAVPIICSATIIGMFLSAQLTRMRSEDYILYLATAGLFGLVPIVFIVSNWVTTIIPASISIGLSSLMLFLIIILKGTEIREELKKRAFI